MVCDENRNGQKIVDVAGVDVVAFDGIGGFNNYFIRLPKNVGVEL